MNFMIRSIFLASLFTSALYASQSPAEIKATILQAAQERRLEDVFSGVKKGGYGKMQNFAVVITYSPDRKEFTREYFEIDSQDTSVYKQALRSR